MEMEDDDCGDLIYQNEEEMAPECDPMFFASFDQDMHTSFGRKVQPVKQEVEDFWGPEIDYIPYSIESEDQHDVDMDEQKLQIKNEPVYEEWEPDMPNMSPNMHRLRNVGQILYFDDQQEEYIEDNDEIWTTIEYPPTNLKPKIEVVNLEDEPDNEDFTEMPVLEKETRKVATPPKPKRRYKVVDGPVPMFNPYIGEPPEIVSSSDDDDDDDVIYESPPTLTRMPSTKPIQSYKPSLRIIHLKQERPFNEHYINFSPEYFFPRIRVNLKRALNTNGLGQTPIKRLKEDSLSIIDRVNDSRYTVESGTIFNRMPKSEIHSIPEIMEGDDENTKKEVRSLGYLTQRFIEFLNQTNGREFDINDAANALGSKYKRRIYDITNVMEGIGMLEKGVNNSSCMKLVIPINIEEMDEETLEAKVEETKEDIGILKQDEDELDHMIARTKKEMKELFTRPENRLYLYTKADEIVSCFPKDQIHVVSAQPGMIINIPDAKVTLKRAKVSMAERSVKYHLKINGVSGALEGYIIEEKKNENTGKSTFFAKSIADAELEKKRYLGFNNYLNSKLHELFSDDETLVEGPIELEELFPIE